jgi:hypothetical protein
MAACRLCHCADLVNGIAGFSKITARKGLASSNAMLPVSLVDLASALPAHFPWPFVEDGAQAFVIESQTKSVSFGKFRHLCFSIFLV